MDKDVYLVIAIILFCIVGLISCVAFNLVGRRKANQKIYEEWEREVVLPEVKTVRARVIDKATDISYTSGAKTPCHKIIFEVTFMTDLGDIVKYTVPKDCFERCNINDYATLVTEGDNFIDFA